MSLLYSQSGPTFAGVSVWVIPLNPPAIDSTLLESELSPAEKTRAERMATASLRRRFVLSHVAMRRVLARELACDAAQLEFDATPEGKPFLKQAGSPSFNLSHSSDLALLAVGFGLDLGVDVEAVRDLDDAPLLSQEYFHLLEQFYVSGGAGAEVGRRFLSVWTRKEAYAKGLGLGLSYPINNYAVPLLEDGPVMDEAAPSLGRGWWVSALHLPEGYVGALATNRTMVPLELCDFNWS